MKRRTKFKIFGLVVLGVIVAGTVFKSASEVKALSYQSNVGVGFTFEPTLNVALSNSDLVINNLSPNTGSDSNVITVNVATNAAYGYDLFSTVGNTANATTELKNGGNSFASLSSNVATLASFDDNKWGYSYSMDSGSSWVSGDYGSTSAGYAGLPLYTGTGVKLASADDNTDSTVQFKIAAKAGATQASGTYTNVVNFYAVTNVGPMSLLDAFIASDAEQINGYYKMQDMTSSICNAVDNSLIPSELQLIDERDNKLYWVAKLADGNCWMTQNLDLAGGTELSSDTTDFVSNYTLPTTNGWTVNDGKLILPASAAKNADNNNLTDSTQFSTDNYAYVFNSGNTVGCGTSGQNTPCYSYYSWDATTLGSGRGISTDNTDAQYSICPKGWKLPTSRTTSAANWRTGSDFYVLAHQYGLDSTTSTSERDNGFYAQAGPGTVPNFLLAGSYGNGSFSNGGSSGYYWSSTSYSNSNYARHLFFYSSYVSSASYSYRRYGFSVRCLLRQ